MRALASRYGWTPDDVGKLTWPQILMYLSDENQGISPTGRKMIQFTGTDAMAKYSNWRRANFGAA